MGRRATELGRRLRDDAPVADPREFRLLGSSLGPPGTRQTALQINGSGYRLPLRGDCPLDRYFDESLKVSPTNLSRSIGHRHPEWVSAVRFASGS
jgi:hypothetical protein